MASIIRRCTILLPNVSRSRYALGSTASPSKSETWAQNNTFTLYKPARYNHTVAPIEDFLDLKVEERENETYLEAVPIDTGREDLVIEKKSEACALCRLNLLNLVYTDVMILSQFIKRDGSLATYYESKLCRRQYKKVSGLIRKAQRCNLIQRPPDYLVPGPWHDLNTYLEPDRKRDQPMRVIKKQYWKL